MKSSKSFSSTSRVWHAGELSSAIYINMQSKHIESENYFILSLKAQFASLYIFKLAFICILRINGVSLYYMVN